MKLNREFAAGAALALAMLAPGAIPTASARQSEQDVQTKERPRKATDAAPPAKTGEGAPATPDDAKAVRSDVPEKTQANRREGVGEADESEIVYYNNFMTTYRLGPEDVISINVFGLDRYSKTGITIPPNGRIDYYFVRDGLLVNGKTTQQVADEITKHLDEYIIEPKVTVSLEKAMSARYYVLGDVAQPGIRVMTRRLSVYEAIVESGGVLSTGDEKKVAVSRLSADGTRNPVLIDVAAIRKGKASDNYYLRPGDVVVVPGNRYKTVKKVLDLLPVISFARIFAGGF